MSTAKWQNIAGSKKFFSLLTVKSLSTSIWGSNVGWNTSQEVESWFFISAQWDLFRESDQGFKLIFQWIFQDSFLSRKYASFANCKFINSRNVITLHWFSPLLPLIAFRHLKTIFILRFLCESSTKVQVATFKRQWQIIEHLSKLQWNSIHQMKLHDS